MWYHVEQSGLNNVTNVVLCSARDKLLSNKHGCLVAAIGTIVGEPIFKVFADIYKIYVKLLCVSQ